MSFTVVYRPEPPHKCETPEYASHGTIIQCDECGKYHRYIISRQNGHGGWMEITATGVEHARKGMLA